MLEGVRDGFADDHDEIALPRRLQPFRQRRKPQTEIRRARLRNLPERRRQRRILPVAAQIHHGGAHLALGVDEQFRRAMQDFARLGRHPCGLGGGGKENLDARQVLFDRVVQIGGDAAAVGGDEFHFLARAARAEIRDAESGRRDRHDREKGQKHIHPRSARRRRIHAHIVRRGNLEPARERAPPGIERIARDAVRLDYRADLRRLALDPPPHAHRRAENGEVGPLPPLGVTLEIDGFHFAATPRAPQVPPSLAHILPFREIRLAHLDAPAERDVVRFHRRDILPDDGAPGRRQSLAFLHAAA